MSDRGRPDRDAELEDALVRARAGDRDAFGDIWTVLAPRVSGYLRGRGVVDVDDVTSEVFLAAFTSLQRFTGGAPQFRSWLFTIAHHKSVDEIRGRVPESAYEPEHDPRSVVSAEDDVMQAVLGADVLRMLGALTDEQRDVLLLRVLADMSIEQVAETTGRTTGAVKQLYHRAIATAQRTAAAPAQDSSRRPVTSRLPLTIAGT